MLDLQNQSNDSKRPRIWLTEEEKNRFLKQAEKDPASAGRTQFLRFLNGEKLTPKQQILAKCYDCDGGHSDGRYDCEVPSCSLHPSMPYKGKFSPCSLSAQW